MDVFRLKQEEGAGLSTDQPPSRLKFYISSVNHQKTGERLLSIITHRNGNGLRITESQVEDLVDWLTDWLLEK